MRPSPGKMGARCRTDASGRDCGPATPEPMGELQLPPAAKPRVPCVSALFRDCQRFQVAPYEPMDYIAISSLIFTLFRTAVDITTFLLSSPQRFSAMLTRTASRCSTKLRAALRQPSLRVAKQPPQCRRFSMPTANATPGAQSAATSSAGMLSPFVSELDKIAPSFRINGSQIRVLQSPTEFYETLKVV